LLVEIGEKVTILIISTKKVTSGLKVAFSRLTGQPVETIIGSVLG